MSIVAVLAKSSELYQRELANVSRTEDTHVSALFQLV